MKKVCKTCYYWTGKRGDGKYKCYCGDCPAKIRDDKEKSNTVSKRLRAEGIKRLGGQIAVLQSRLDRLQLDRLHKGE
jgi:hypothetical protein